MTSNKNIFEVLSDQDSDEENGDGFKKQKVAKPKNNKKETSDQRKHNDDDDNERIKKSKQNTSDIEDKKNRGGPDRYRDQRKPKVSADPHPLDRRSGRDTTGVKPQFRKQGAGSGNVGSIKDELTGRDKNERQDEEEVIPSDEEPQEQKKTLQDYYAQIGVDYKSQFEQKQEEQKKKKEQAFDQEALQKEKLTIMKTKEELKQKEIESKKKDTDQKKVKNQDYAVGMQTEFADLLGFKTGLKLVDLPKEKKPREEFQRPAKKDDAAVEGEATKEKPAEQAGEAEGDEGKKEEGAEGGRRGGRRDDGEGEKKRHYDDKRERQGGNKQYGDRKKYDRYDDDRSNKKPHHDKKKGPQVNVESEKDFPKLG